MKVVSEKVQHCGALTCKQHWTGKELISKIKASYEDTSKVSNPSGVPFLTSESYKSWLLLNTYIIVSYFQQYIYLFLDNFIQCILDIFLLPASSHHPPLYSPTPFHPALKLLLVFSFLIEPMESGLCWCVITLSRIISLNSLPSLLATIKCQQLSVSGGILHAPALCLNLFWLWLVHYTCLCLFVSAFCLLSFSYYYHILKIFTYTIDFY